MRRWPILIFVSIVGCWQRSCVFVLSVLFVGGNDSFLLFFV
jgi:hypothetical protein